MKATRASSATRPSAARHLHVVREPQWVKVIEVPPGDRTRKRHLELAQVAGIVEIVRDEIVLGHGWTEREWMVRRRGPLALALRQLGRACA